MKPLKRLIYQTHRDLKLQHGDYAQYSFKSVQQYCKRHSIDYICDTSVRDNLWFGDRGIMFNKFRCLPFLRDYDQILYLDSDIIVTPWAPNIFDEYKDQAFIGARFTVCDQYMYSDDLHKYGPINGGVLMFNNVRSPAHGSEYTLYHFKGGLNFPGDVDHRLSDGVWWQDWDVKYADRPLAQNKDGSINEEWLLMNVVADYGIKTFHIDRKWNFNIQYTQGKHEAYFWHFEEKTKTLMRQYYERLFVGRAVST